MLPVYLEPLTGVSCIWALQQISSSHQTGFSPKRGLSRPSPAGKDNKRAANQTLSMQTVWQSELPVHLCPPAYRCTGSEHLYESFALNSPHGICEWCFCDKLLSLWTLDILWLEHLAQRHISSSGCRGRREPLTLPAHSFPAGLCGFKPAPLTSSASAAV